MKLSNLELGFNEERTFGVEMECILKADNRSEVVGVLEGEGITARAGWSPDDSPNGDEWLVTYDGSLEGNGEYGYMTAEVVSPILKGREGLEKLKRVTEILNNQLDAEINKSCGLHIHHDITNLDLTRIKRLFKLYAQFEPAIDSLLPKSRRKDRNTYCKTLRTKGGRVTFREYLNKLDEQDTIQELRNYAMKEDDTGYHTRYYKLNFDPYEDKGTVEFRQHSGTTDFNKIKSWILLGQALIQRTKCKVVVRDWQKEIENDQQMMLKKGSKSSHYWSLMKRRLHLQGRYGASEEMQEMARYYNKRRRKFAEQYNTTPVQLVI